MLRPSAYTRRNNGGGSNKKMVLPKRGKGILCSANAWGFGLRKCLHLTDFLRGRGFESEFTVPLPAGGSCARTGEILPRKIISQWPGVPEDAHLLRTKNHSRPEGQIPQNDTISPNVFPCACFFVRRCLTWPYPHQAYTSAHGNKHCHFQAPTGACARRTVNSQSNSRSLMYPDYIP